MSEHIYIQIQKLFGLMNAWGGKRKGAGRRSRGIPGCSHTRKPEHKGWQPVHITMRALLRCLRSQRVFPAIRAAIRAINRQRGERFRIVEFSVQTNHIHLIVEADLRTDLSHGMRALTARIAKGVNRVLGRRGCVFPDRFHERALTSPRDVKNTLRYVLANFRKHRTAEANHGVAKDPCSSAPYFLDFAGEMTRTRTARQPSDHIPVLRARTWLLAAGWKTLGLFSSRAAPST